MPKRMRVVTAGSAGVKERPVRRVITSDNPTVSNRLTENEKLIRKYITSTTFGKTSVGEKLTVGSVLSSNYQLGGMRAASDVLDSGTSQFYSPQLSTDFLEKPQNLRERRAFYRFFYNTNEIVGQAIDIHSTLPLSKLRLVAPKGKNPHQNKYVMKFFEDMCEEIKLFKTLIEITHEFNLFGNCLDKNACLRTTDGYKKAKDIRLNDMVLTDKGHYRRVLKICKRPSEEIIDIKCWKDHRVLSVTGEHPVEVLRGDRFVFEQAKNISSADYIRVIWPIETEDIKTVSLFFPEKYKKTEGGYELTFKVNRPRGADAFKARKDLVDWLGSLTDPIIKTRLQIANDLGVPVKVLDNVINHLDEELDVKFHERIGAKGWQQGSQVIWYPVKEQFEVTESYTIIKNRFLPSIDTLSIDNDFCYLAGYWLGDGTLSRDSSRETWGRGLWQIATADLKNLDRLRKIMANIFGQKCLTEWVDEKNIYYIKVISNPAFIEWWADNFGETSFGENYKRIPEWLLKLPVEKLKHFLAGLVDSDGCVSTTGELKWCVVNIGMCSKVVMDSVRDIAFKCGLIVSYNKTSGGYLTVTPLGRDCVTRDYFYITTTVEDSCFFLTEYATKKIPDNVPFVAENKKFLQTEDGLAFKVKDISQRTYKDFVYNFEVEEDHTYQVEGFSTHNCFIFAEESDGYDDLTPEESAKKKEEAQQRSELLKNKYKVEDKDPLYKGWKKLIVLPPDQVRVRKLPLTDEVAIEYVPDPQTKEFIVQGGYSSTDAQGNQKKNSMPAELQDKVKQSGVIPLDTDPYSGSHVYHLARKKSQYEPLGVSIIERCINTLVLLDKLRQAQTSIASRHMTPMRIVWMEEASTDDIDNLREQVDMALVDPDFSIISNTEIHWEEMGSQGRLLDIEAENEAGLGRLLAGLGMTREILTGEGSYSGSKISLEIMNTQYLLYREVIQDYVENYLFKPVAKKKGFIEIDDYGNEVLLYPKLSFTRLAIRDNEQFFDSVFQLYQKGSVSIDLILDILNIDPASTKQKIEQDLFTVNDSIFNELMRNVYTNVSQPLVEQTDIVDKLSKYLHLEKLEQPGAPPGSKRFSSNNELMSEEDKEKATKLAKVMKFFKSNPEMLDKVFNNVSQR